ncbi:MAG: EthD domain-containing protein [Candidatus Binatia bacterium]
MLHLLYFITRKSTITDSEFHRYWREVHGPIAKKIEQIKRYAQSHRIAFSGMDSSYDGVAEVWLENETAMMTLRQNPEYLQGALADEPNFIDMNRVEWMATNDHVILDGPQTSTQAKLIFQLKRKSGMSLTDARQYWIDVHGPIVCRLPGLRRYIQCHLVDAAYNYAEPKWDGVAQLWVDDVAAMQKMLESSEFKQAAWPDGEKFLDLSLASSFVAQEHHVVWPT